MDEQFKYSTGMQVTFLFLYVGLGFATAGACTILFSKLYLGATQDTMTSAIIHSKDPFVLRVVQVINVLFVMVLPSIFFSRTIHNKPFQYLKFSSVISGKQFFLLVSIVLAALMVSGSLGMLNEKIPLPTDWVSYFKEMEENYNKQVSVITNLNSISDYLAALIVLGLLPALAEEMLFRGCLQQLLSGIFRQVWIGIILTSILFSIMHLSFYGFMPRLFLGLLLGYVFFKSGNIWHSIAIHFLNNAFALTQMYAVSLHGQPETEVLQENLPLYYGLVGSVLLFFLIKLFNRETELVISTRYLRK
jgi:hypothetical protein